MDLEEIRRVIFRRIQYMDSENALKVMGYLLLQGRGEQDMLQLAICSDTALRSIVAKAYHDLGFTPAIPLKSGLPNPDSSYPAVSSSYHFESTFQAPSFSPSSPLDLQDFNSFSSQMSKATEEDTSKLCYSYLQSQLNPQYQHLSGIASPALEPWQFDTGLRQGSHSNSSSLFSHGHQNISNAFSPHYSSKMLQSAVSYPLMPSSLQKPCLYFARGYCKHGNNCRFLHSPSSSPAAFPETQRDRQNSDSPRPITNGTGTSSSLDSLESELRELLRERKVPLSIASLPQLYFEKFGKTLQADGYLTESQRHGKPGFSLTKLLSKLKSSVMVIDRPHGQHAVILVEDENKYKEPVSAGNPAAALSSFNAISRQIYLTFPAESTFKEEDVIVHFRAYGPVHDVRIPYQQKRMFGFVTFMYSETVTTILAEGNPHYICGCRVLVKPYKDKVKLNESRKTLEEATPPIGSASCFYHLFPSAVPKYTKNGDDYSKGFVTGTSSKEEQILALESSLQEMKLEEKNGNNNNNNNNNVEQNVVKVAGSFSEASATSTFYRQLEDEQSRSMQPDNDVPLTAEDCFHLEPSVFSCVLDVLDSDGKEEYAELSNNKHSPEKSEWKVLGDPFTHYKSVSDSSSNASFVNKQTLSTPPFNWNEPTLFAWSVY